MTGVNGVSNLCGLKGTQVPFYIRKYEGLFWQLSVTHETRFALGTLFWIKIYKCNIHNYVIKGHFGAIFVSFWKIFLGKIKTERLCDFSDAFSKESLLRRTSFVRKFVVLIWAIRVDRLFYRCLFVCKWSRAWLLCQGLENAYENEASSLFNSKAMMQFLWNTYS